MTEGAENGTVLSRADVRGQDGQLRMHPRSVIRRELMELPEFGEGKKAWCWGVSTKDRLIIDEYAGGGPGTKGHNAGNWMEAMAAAALRESDADDALSLFEVPGRDAGKLLEMGFALLNRVVNKCFELDFGIDLGERIMSALQDFGTAGETP